MVRNDGNRAFAGGAAGGCAGRRRVAADRMLFVALLALGLGAAARGMAQEHTPAQATEPPAEAAPVDTAGVDPLERYWFPLKERVAERGVVGHGVCRLQRTRGRGGRAV